MLIEIICQICGEKRKVVPSVIKSGGGKFCSHNCYWKNLKGKPGYWKNKKLSKEHCEKLSKSRMGRTVWNKGIKSHQSGKNHYNWKGGEHKNEAGYIMIYSPSHPYKTKRNCVRRSHLVMESHIGRYLTRKEVVHHINKIVNDDRIKNLMLFKNSVEHMRYHKLLHSLK